MSSTQLSKAHQLSKAQGFSLFALAALSNLSNADIFTDAPECAASVAAAQNLAYLANSQRMRNQHRDPGFLGVLHADGAAVCDVTIYCDGSMKVELPADFDSSGRAWTVALENGSNIIVSFFAGECSDDDAWVIGDPAAFYAAVIDA